MCISNCLSCSHCGALRRICWISPCARSSTLRGAGASALLCRCRGGDGEAERSAVPHSARRRMHGRRRRSAVRPSALGDAEAARSEEAASSAWAGAGVAISLPGLHSATEESSSARGGAPAKSNKLVSRSTAATAELAVATAPSERLRSPEAAGGRLGVTHRNAGCARGSSRRLWPGEGLRAKLRLMRSTRGLGFALPRAPPAAAAPVESPAVTVPALRFSVLRHRFCIDCQVCWVMRASSAPSQSWRP